jgi:hypothetical protein
MLPIRWTDAQLAADVARAKALFREERLGETIEEYERRYEAIRPAFHRLIISLRSIAAGETDLAPFIATPVGLTAFRYLAAPPMSADDLSTLADIAVGRNLHSRPADVAEALRTVLAVLDPFRFPWIGESRNPTSAELDVAVTASAAMVAAQNVQTGRRAAATAGQEQAVKDALIEAGFAETPRRPIALLDDAPAPMMFCGESMLGSTRADIVVRLQDRRVLAIECKASNSAVNSFKRVNHEALGKATKWRRDFGDAQVVPAAVLSGVFSPANLASAQNAGLFLFWQFRLEDLAAFAA